MSATLFRTVLVATLVFVILASNAAITFYDTLLPILQNYLAQIGGKDISTGEAVPFLSFLPVAGITIVLYIGLWNFKSWARTTYLLIFAAIDLIIFLAIMIVIFAPTPPTLYLFYNLIIENASEPMFFFVAYLFIADMLWGFSVTMMYRGELGQIFEANKFNTPPSPESQNPH